MIASLAIGISIRTRIRGLVAFLALLRHVLRGLVFILLRSVGQINFDLPIVLCCCCVLLIFSFLACRRRCRLGLLLLGYAGRFENTIVGLRRWCRLGLLLLGCAGV